MIFLSILLLCYIYFFPRLYIFPYDTKEINLKKRAEALLFRFSVYSKKGLNLSIRL